MKIKTSLSPMFAGLCGDSRNETRGLAEVEGVVTCEQCQSRLPLYLFVQPNKLETTLVEYRGTLAGQVKDLERMKWICPECKKLNRKRANCPHRPAAQCEYCWAEFWKWVENGGSGSSES